MLPNFAQPHQFLPFISFAFPFASNPQIINTNILFFQPFPSKLRPSQNTMSLPLSLPQQPLIPPFLVTLFFCILLNLFPCYLALPDSATATLEPLFPTPSQPATIPAFPEQSDVVGCPLILSNELFDGIKSACGATKDGSADKELHHSRCCPVLAAWLYFAYSATSLRQSSQGHSHSHSHTLTTTSSSYDMPLLPDDSETCVNDLEKALKVKGIELIRPNETCDVVYCYCGIRLHPLSCPDAFSVSQSGELVGDSSVRRLERNCLSSSTNVNGFPGLGGCSKCLNSLYLVSFSIFSLFIMFWCSLLSTF